MKSKIVFVEDDLTLGTIIAKALEECGFEVNYLNAIHGLRETIANFCPNLLILDIEVGTRNCLDELPSIRLSCPAIPIIITSSHVDGAAVARSYDTGADQYIKKPYDIDELLYHINRLLTISASIEAHILPFGSYRLDTFSHELFHKEKLVKQLSPKEFLVLERLLMHQGEFVKRMELLQEVWGNESYTDSLNNIIAALRKHFHQGGDIQIVTNKGYGYQLIIRE